MEALFRQLDGVLETQVGYMGGETLAVTYDKVCAGATGHIEIVDVVFDPSLISYNELLRVLFDNHNPTTPNQQGPDLGVQYSSAIFTYSDEQAAQAQQMLVAIDESERWPNPTVTVVRPAEKFWR
ncbi:MAG: peptide-methionine (S)-S-oxide reductase MsrA, partial [Planctomycetes bacterium]|nr:peptide-methionine (S)-S-oxide reductase MsrA [Planctomycetota bacterium]